MKNIFAAARLWRRPPILLSMSTLMVLAACTPNDDHGLRMVAPRLEVDQSIGNEIAGLIGDGTRLSVKLVPNPDPTRSGLDALASGAADLALASNFENFRPEVATVLPLYPTVLHIAHRADLVFVDTADLLGRHSIFAGPPGSASRLLVTRALAGLGLAGHQPEYVERDACADVIIIFAPISRDLTTPLQACGEYRLHGLGPQASAGSGGVVDAVTLLDPRLRAFVIPKGTYGAMTPAPVLTLAVDKFLVARRGVSSAAVYDLIDEVVRLRPALSVRHPGLFRELSGDFDASSATFMLHPGAADYLRRDEPDIYERYSGVAEVVVTLVIGLSSGAFAILRIYAVRRKNRIDAYYSAAIALRKRGQAAGSREEREEIILALKAMQDNAFEMLVDEKLAADESFRIFITLIHDSVAELQSTDRRTVGTDNALG